MSYRDLLDHGLRLEEGKRNRPYTDTTGHITVGIGRNLTDRGLSDDEIEYLFTNDKGVAESAARSLCPSFDELSDVRRYVLCDMAFNLGQNRLQEFVRFFQAIREERWTDAAMEILESVASKQEPRRFTMLANAMETDAL